MENTIWSSTISFMNIQTTTSGSLSDSRRGPGGPGGPDGPGGPGGPGGPTQVVLTDLQRNLALYGYICLFLLGYFGHISTILIFLQRTLRSVSTSVLFIAIIISDVIYLSVSIHDFLYIGLGLTPLDSQTNADLSNAFCRFRSFLQSFAMCSSAWLLVAVSVDRWIRIRFPFRVRRFCTIKRVLSGTFVIVICAVALNSHLLLPSFGSLIGTVICGPTTDATYVFFFRQVMTALKMLSL